MIDFNNITVSKYTKLPKEEQDKILNDLLELYINQNLSREEILANYNIGLYFFKWILRENNIKKDKSLVQKNIDKTFLSKYGHTGYANRDKIKETMLKKYGVDNPLKSKEIKEKVIATNNKKYGGNAPACSKEVQEKMQKTCLEKYGVTNIRKSPIFKEVIKDKMSKTIQEKYGVPYYCLTKDCISHQGKTISKINLRFAELLEENNIKYEMEYTLEDKSFDFKVDNTLIEINPTYTHNSTIGPYIKGELLPGKDSNYHLDKTLLANKYEFRCLHVFDNDDWNKIIYLLLPKKKVYARQCEIKEVSIKETNDFLNTFHLQNTCKGQQVRLGLYHNNKLIQLMTFGKPRYNKNYQYELLRLCSYKNYIVIGGSHKLWNYFLKTYNPSNVISYCDNSKFSGRVYETLEMELKYTTAPVGNWYNFNNEYISDSLLRQLGFDKLFGTNYGKGTSNEQLMIEHGWLQVYNCGQKVFTYN